MTHILAIDTSTDACSVAILTPSHVQQTLIVAPREHTQRLLPSIESLLAEHELCLQQFDAIAFGVGPGSFTGLRIALSTAQGLAYGADLPLIPISTLETMAHTALRAGLVKEGQTVIPVIDARMNEVYWSAYQYTQQEQLWHTLQEETIAAPEIVAANSLLQPQNEIVAIGSGWHYACLSQCLSQPAHIEVYPEAYDMSVLAKHAWDTQGSDATISPLSAVPTYMRNEISWKKRQRIREQNT
jgi:tRNA threonylcarbamoyladenosine biosynthesis protein TsaB